MSTTESYQDCEYTVTKLPMVVLLSCHNYGIAFLFAKVEGNIILTEWQKRAQI